MAGSGLTDVHNKGHGIVEPALRVGTTEVCIPGYVEIDKMVLVRHFVDNHVIVQMFKFVKGRGFPPVFLPAS